MHQLGPRTQALHSLWAETVVAASLAPEKATHATALAAQTRMAWNVRENGDLGAAQPHRAHRVGIEMRECGLASAPGVNR